MRLSSSSSRAPRSALPSRFFAAQAEAKAARAVGKELARLSALVMKGEGPAAPGPLSERFSPARQRPARPGRGLTRPESRAAAPQGSQGLRAVATQLRTIRERVQVPRSTRHAPCSLLLAPCPLPPTTCQLPARCSLLLAAAMRLAPCSLQRPLRCALGDRARGRALPAPAQPLPWGVDARHHRQILTPATQLIATLHTTGRGRREARARAGAGARGGAGGGGAGGAARAAQAPRARERSALIGRGGVLGLLGAALPAKDFGNFQSSKISMQAPMVPKPPTAP
jgi:hypothetical protein